MKDSDNLPNLRHLRVFETVARLESVSQASALINLSQPAVTQAILNLESKFGVQLFERRHSGSYLTQFGQLLLFRTKRLFTSIRSALEELFDGLRSNENMNVDALIAKMTTTQMRCLIAVSENVSFDDAARAIGVSRPSLHRAARDFERLVGRAIYCRGARGTSTTNKGSALARRLKLALQELNYAVDEINAHKGVITSRISVGVLASSGSFVLGQVIDKFLASYPGARIRVIEEPYEQLLSDLRAGNIDFLFSVLRRPSWATDIRETILFKEPYVIVMRPHHPLSKVKSIGRKELANYDWIVPGRSTPRFLAFEQLFASAKKKAPTAVETTSRSLARALLTMSNRLSLLTKYEALFEEKLGTLKIIPAKTKLPRRTYGIATRINWYPTALQQKFLAMLIAQGRHAATDALS